jgi:SAM-dependent methyltransferase
MTTTARPLTATQLEHARRTRRSPKPTQFDYLHLRRLRDDLAAVLAGLDGRLDDVLDVYCGSRPYEDLLPEKATCIGLDVPGNPYGVADVVSDEFLPFPDQSFDLVMCIEAFHYVPDPAHGAQELRRVVRPGGHALVAVPFVWEYDRSILEHRFTGPALAALFSGWDDVQVIENGGRAVAWATLSGLVLERMRARIPRLGGAGRILQSIVPLACLGVNGVAMAMDRAERSSRGPYALPMNLLAVARRPHDG